MEVGADRPSGGMSAMSTPPRPRLVTMAGTTIIAGSVLLVLLTFEQISGLRSLDTREAVEDALSRPPADGLGLSVSDVLDVLRVLAMACAACAAAAAILGGYALRRSRSARIGLGVLAVPLLVTGLAAGGLLATVVAVSIALLWLEPARDWYDGVTRPEPTRRPEPRPPVAPQPPPFQQHPQEPQQQPQQHPQQAQAPAGPRPYAGFGTPPPAYPIGPTGAMPAPAPPARRPTSVVWACALTWAFSGLVAVGMLLSAVVIAVSPELVLDELRKQDPQLAEDVTEDLLVGSAIGTAVVLIVWCVAASVVAFFAFRRAGWAQITLLVSAAVAGVGCLVGVAIGTFPLLVPLLGCAMTIGLLNRREVRAWFAARGTI